MGIPPPGLMVGHFQVSSIYGARRPQGVKDWLLIYTHGGRGHFESEGQELRPRRGDIVLIRPDTPQDYGPDPAFDRWDLYWAHFLPRPDWKDWIHWPEAAPGHLMLSVRDPLLQKTLAACFKKTLTYFRSDLPMKTALTMSALETLLLHAEGVNPKRSPRLLDPRIQEISQFIRVQYREDLTVAVLARRCRLSPSRFAHLFKEEMGHESQPICRTATHGTGHRVVDVDPGAGGRHCLRCRV